MHYFIAKITSEVSVHFFIHIFCTDSSIIVDLMEIKFYIDR